jgi:acyl-CoA thioester hydrolase
MDRGVAAERFEKKITVMENDIDLYRHVNNTVYLRWVQDVSTDHWVARATEEQQRNIGWVVVRHEIDYLSPALLGDEITGWTWIGDTRRTLCERFVEFQRDSEQKIIARSRTLWCPIDMQTFRAKPVSEDIYNCFYV